MFRIAFVLIALLAWISASPAQVVAPLGPGSGGAGGGGGGGSPCTTTALSLQYNNAGAFGCVSGWTTNGSTALTGGASTTVAIGGATIGGNALAVTGTSLFNNAVTINLNATATPTPITGTALQVVGADATVGRVQVNSFGAIAAVSVTRANGTGSSPTAVVSGDQLGGFNSYGYRTSGGAGYSGPSSSVQSFATENWTSTANGTKIVLATTPNLSTTLTTAVTVDQDQSITVAGAGNVNGKFTNALGTITTSQPATFTQTWNAGGVTFQGLLINVTSTAAAAASNVLDIQLAGVSQLFVTRSGITKFLATAGFASDDGKYSLGAAQSSVAQFPVVRIGGTGGALNNYIQASTSGILNFGTTNSGQEATLQYAWAHWAGQSRVSTQFDKTSATLADITGLTATVTAGKTYKFRAYLPITADTTGGYKVAIAGTATATVIIYNVTAINNGTGLFTVTSKQTALGGSAGATAGGTDILTIVEGTITVNAGGTLTVQFAQNTANGTSSVLVGSSFVVQEFS